MLGSKGHVVKREDFDKMLGEYYKLRGWDDEGRPSKEKLVQLGLPQSLNAVGGLYEEGRYDSYQNR